VANRLLRIFSRSHRRVQVAAPRQIFSKVGSLLSLLDQITIEVTFENFTKTLCQDGDSQKSAVTQLTMESDSRADFWEYEDALGKQRDWAGERALAMIEKAEHLQVCVL